MWLGIAALFIANALGGALNAVLVKIGVQEIPPLTFSAARFILATIVFLPIYAAQKEKRIKLRDVLILFACSIPFTVNIALFSIGIQFTTAIISQIIYLLMPIIVFFLAYFMFRERLTKDKLIGLAIALSGVLFLFYQSATKQEILSLGTPLGNSIILIGAFSTSLFLVFLQKTAKIYSSITTSFATFLTTSILLTIVSPIELFIRPLIITDITARGIASLFILAIFSTAIFWFLIQFGTKRTSAFSAAIFHYIAPFFTAVSAIPILGERLTVNLVLGGLLILAGVFYATTYTQLKRRI